MRACLLGIIDIDGLKMKMGASMLSRIKSYSHGLIVRERELNQNYG